MLDNLLKHQNLSKKGAKADLIIWPESGVSFPIEKDLDIFPKIAEFIPDGSFLITGAPRYQKQNEQVKFWNSTIMLNHYGEVINYYDKINLVPFGEFIPFRYLIPFGSLVNLGVDFTAGQNLKNFQIANDNFTPLICYDAIFPGRVNNSANWLLNTTNDIWFYRDVNGKNISSGPYQHFDIVRARTIEEGLPMLRVANAGISAIIDPYGRIIKKLSLYEEGFIDGKVPSPIESKTIFAKYGNLPIIILVIAIILAQTLILARVNKYKK